MPPRQIRAKATDADRHSNPSDAILDRSVALNTTVSGLTHLTGLTSSDGCTAEGNADAPSAVTDQSGSPLLRMRDEAKRESFALLDNIGLGDVFPKSASTSKRQHQHEEEQSKASSSKLESYLSKKGRARQKSHKSKKSRTTMTDDGQEWQEQAALHPQAQEEAQAPHTLNDPDSEEYKAALFASSEYMSFDDNSAISRRHHLNKAQGWFPWELDAPSEQVGGHLEQPNNAKTPAARSKNNTKLAGIASPAEDADHGRQHPEEPTAGMPTAGMPTTSFSQWGHTAARTARTLLGRCHVFMDEHDVDEWIDTASSTFHKALRAGRAQCVASCNNAGS